MCRTAIASLLAIFAMAASTASAQYVPFSQESAPGQIGGVFTTVNPGLRGAMQAAVWDVPGDVEVQTFHAGGQPAAVTAEDEPIGIEVGHVHRFKLTIPDGNFGREIYPSVELIDRLHPPAGRDAEFPVVLELTETDVADILGDRLVTKVVYVQPRNANYVDPLFTRLPTTRVPLAANVMKEAVLRGRPIAIIRIGGRMPLPGEDAGTFFGSGGRVVVPVPVDGFLNPDARVPLCETACGPGAPAGSSPQLYPDEYLCDGGDTGITSTGPVTSPLDLAFEETIGTHIAHDGELKSIPSTRICIYAPAFGAVTIASGGQIGTSVLQPAGAHDRRELQRFVTTHSPVANERTEGGEAVRIRSRLSGVMGDQSDSLATAVNMADVNQNVVGSFEDRGMNSPEINNKVTQAIIGERIRAAIEYSENRTPLIYALNEELVEVYGTEVGGVFTHYEDLRPEGNLTLVKMADKSGANVGEVVEFTIRFDNIGGKPLTKVTISDHLSPRLRLVPDSTVVSRDADVVVEPDGRGSVLLQVRLTEPLPGKQGGTVKFKTVVR